MARTKAISTDTDKLREALALMPEGKRIIGEKLLIEIMFLAGMLSELRRTVMEDGTDSPALKMYNATIQRYALLYKQFSDLLPKQAGDNAESALLDFIKKG